MEYLAHYDEQKNLKQLLSSHLLSVAELSSAQVPPNVKFQGIDNFTVKSLIYWIGYFHDLGKYTEYFQYYLLQNINSKFKKHAHISACFIYQYLLDRVVQNENMIAFLSYLCVRLHHSELKRDNLFLIRNEIVMWKDVQTIGNNIIKKSEEILEDLNLNEKITIDNFKKFLQVDLLKKKNSPLKRVPSQLRRGYIKNEKWFFLLIYLFSLLIDIDKFNSAELTIRKNKSVLPNKVDQYIYKRYGENKKSDIINRRNKVRNTMLSTIMELTNEEIKDIRFFTLTAPTGIGKTLSSLQSSLLLQQKIKEIEGYVPRIITAIPFINIIEQNKQVYEDVFSNEINLVVHHRLTDFSIIKSSEEVPVDKALLEVEAWEGDVILTTFVQFFQSIFTGKNKLLKKINKLAGSIVVLDEAQAIPEKYMPLVGAVLQKIGEYYGTRFILMTATQPKLLEFGDLLLEHKEKKDRRIIPLLRDYEEYFKGLNRTKLIPVLKKRFSNERFIKFFREKKESNKSALIVVNTIKRSIDIFNELKKELKKEGDSIPIFYLSTNLIPLQRRKVIKKVKNILDSEKPVILVSTQTIEAGVDLDFDMAFRDFAPIDSLIQTAGRVNREGKKGEYLPIYIVQLESDNHYIYELFNRHSTMNLLGVSEEVKESEYGILAEKYYTMALNREVSEVSKRLWNEGVLKLDFEALKDFKLIESPQEIYDVFVEDGSELATNLADLYEVLLKDNKEFTYDLAKIFDKNLIKKFKRKLNIFERKALLRLVIAKMSDYIVQVRVSRLKENRPLKFKIRGNSPSNMFWIPFNQMSKYYDEKTGFISKNGDAFV